MKKVLISSYDMEVGGVERSLISMLNNFDYENYDVDLLLYNHSGDFMDLIPQKTNLLKEVKEYKTFRMPIFHVIMSQQFLIGIMRILAKLKGGIGGKGNSFKQLQYMWRYTLPLLPNIEEEYDVAISYLWPHDFIANKVNAKKKIAWIHTDYSTIDTDVKVDLKMWSQYDHIISISESVTEAFLTKYPTLEDKIILVENITSPKIVKELSKEEVFDVRFENDNFNIVSVGRLSHPKAFDNAVKALKILHDKGLTNIKWYIVGYGPDEALLRELISKNNLEKSFILLGKKTNPYPYMNKCDLYVQPSRYEGKAVTIGEAQILSKPILITNYATAHSQVNNGFDGFICDLSIKGIANGIEKLFNDSILRNKLIRNCKMQEYSNSNELKKLYKIIEI